MRLDVGQDFNNVHIVQLGFLVLRKPMTDPPDALFNPLEGQFPVCVLRAPYLLVPTGQRLLTHSVLRLHVFQRLQ